MFDTLLVIAMAIVVLVLAWTAFVTVALRVIESKKSDHSDTQTVSDSMIPLQVETAGNQFLCYNAKTMDFVCQGSSLEEIRSSFKLRYPDRSASVVAGDQNAVSTLQQQLKRTT